MNSHANDHDNKHGDSSSIKAIIESAWEGRADLSPARTPPEVARAVERCLNGLESGEFRVAEPAGGAGEWQVNQWLKKAVLLCFRIHENEVVDAAYTHFFDKLPLRWGGDSGHQISEIGARIVPPATVRRGAHIGHDVVLMPSYVNIGAYVGPGTMVDTWATVGSCAQIGKNVHISGGVGIGGVLEPVQGTPVIIEDGGFLGSRCIIVEGVRVGKEAVIGANVTLTASSKIIDVTGTEAVETKGYVPERSVVIPGSYTKKFDAGEYQVPCALIIGTRKASTDLKTSLNQVLRDHHLAV